jgi:hypothetical protein
VGNTGRRYGERGRSKTYLRIMEPRLPDAPVFAVQRSAPERWVVASTGREGKSVSPEPEELHLRASCMTLVIHRIHLFLHIKRHKTS